MLKPGKPVHVNNAVVPVNAIRVNIPRRRSPKVRNQNLAGSDWNGGQILTGVTWNEGSTTPSGEFTGAKTNHVTITNSQVAGGFNLQVSFDGGNNYFTLAPGDAYDQSISIYYFMVRGVGGNSSFEAILVLPG